MAPTYHIGQRISYDSHLCTVSYIGTVAGTPKEWLGVEWDDSTRGKHDGEHEGIRYFSCRSRSKTAASFVRPTRTADPVQSFVEAVHQKYASEFTERRDAINAGIHIRISSKVVEEVGFEKIRHQLAQLQELKIVIVDGLRISFAENAEQTIKDVCPKIVELDLSRNLFEHVVEIIKICQELDHIRELRLNGNRIDILSEHLSLLQARNAFVKIEELSLDEMLITWEEVCLLVNNFPALTTLSTSSNDWKSINAPTTLLRSLSTWTLKSLTLDYNSLLSITDITPLSSIPFLEKLHLKGNQINKINDGDRAKPVFGKQLHYIDLSYNDVSSWAFVDELPNVFPGLTALRFSHNPVYDTASKGRHTASSVEEGYMFTLARIASLKILNFSNITPAERTNAEIFYLSRIGQAMAAVPESEENIIMSQHQRYEELCELYGAPTVIRAGPALDPNFLEARLIKFIFYMHSSIESGQSSIITKNQEIPKSFDVYQVKGIVGRLFELRPLKLRLIWETGEWDPIAGYEEEEDSDEEDNWEEKGDGTDVADNEKRDGLTRDRGKWMRREVELENGTRQIGFMVGGMEAKVRVELLPDTHT